MFNNKPLKKDQDRLHEIDESSFGWRVIENGRINSLIQIDHRDKILYIKFLHEELPSKLFIEFLNNLFKTRNNHRSPEIDLFFENFEAFYNET